MPIKTLLLVGCGGFIGAAARYVATLTIQNRLMLEFPMGTLTVNIVGSFILGVVVSLVQHWGLASIWQFFLVTGVCGGFTTFSSFSFETLVLFQNGRPGTAILYVFLSLLVGLGAVALGYFIPKWCV